MMKQRSDGRAHTDARPVRITYDVFTASAASVLFELGNTKLLVTVSLQSGVPQFLRGKGVGWLTAEYALLPNATNVRTPREASSAQKNGRTVEISRLIGRTLRTVFDAKAIGEQTIYVDCDVLQADGGTRTAAITAASLALLRAQGRWLEERKISTAFMKDGVGAISIGVAQGQLLVDPNYQEDQVIEADFNVVVTTSNKCIELQGGAEKAPIEWETFERIRQVALQAIQQMHKAIPLAPSIFESYVPKAVTQSSQKVYTQVESAPQSAQQKEKVPFFSLQNRKIHIGP